MHAYKATGKEDFVCDATVPRQRLPEMIERAREIAASLGLDVATVGHAGDGNLHPVILYKPEQLETVDVGASEISAAALDLGGTLTGEHGISTAKLQQMSHQFGPVELAAFRAIKRAFNPGGVLNPRVMLPPPEQSAERDNTRPARDYRGPECCVRGEHSRSIRARAAGPLAN
jgi:glycolate oxidase